MLAPILLVAGTLVWPAPIMGAHPVPPSARTVVSDYRCGSANVRLAVRYDDEGRAALVEAARNGRPVADADLRRMDEGLGRLETLTAIVPECSDDVHVLTGLGRSAEGRAQVLIIWTPFQIAVSGLLPPDERMDRQW